MDTRVAIPIDEYCRTIERHLCQKNDGHLIRVVGPSFTAVTSWVERGIPLKIALAGIDRYFERYYKKGPRRRPVRVEFCEADVLDVFDEWRRAIGAGAARTAEDASGDAADGGAGEPAAKRSSSSLPAHLERVLLRLTSARASGRIDDTLDPLLDRVSAELDSVRARAGGLRGQARAEALARLDAIDRELIDAVRARQDAKALADLDADAATDLEAFRGGMAPAAWERAKRAAADTLLRERLGLPVVSFT